MKRRAKKKRFGEDPATVAPEALSEWTAISLANATLAAPVNVAGNLNLLSDVSAEEPQTA